MRIAVVGAGISGIGSAWLLAKHHEVHLFEAAPRLGGHAHTVTVKESNGNKVPIDTGFLVYNELTYPHLTRFFKYLNVETMDSDMSLSIQVKSKKLEWAGTNLNTVFSQRKNLFNPRFYKMIFDILRFGREAEANLALARRHGWSLNDLLQNRNFSQRFCTDYLLPIGAAIWSTPETKMLDFPAQTFLAFFINHKLLQVNNRPVWRTVKGGSIQYVQKAAAGLEHIHLNAEVISVDRKNGKVNLTTKNGTEEFDKVILATHTPISKKILKDQSPLESQVLSAISFEPNRTLLHSDQNLMPKKKLCWSAWNVLGSNDLKESQKVSLTYYINQLQRPPTQIDYFVTLNPATEIKSPIQEFQYSHPQFDRVAIEAQQKLDSIQGNGGVYFAGAWSRYGFHEDGLLSAVNIAKLLHVDIPWENL